MARRIGVGDRVAWVWHSGGRKGTVEGIGFEVNPRIAPGARYGVRDERGETYYPLAKVRRSR